MSCPLLWPRSMGGTDMDALSIPVPDYQIWAVILGWIGCYVAGRYIGGAR